MTGVADLQLGSHNLSANEQDYQKTAMSAPMVSPFRACPGYGPSSFAISPKWTDIGPLNSTFKTPGIKVP